jgi:hypothetical protein
MKKSITEVSEVPNHAVWTHHGVSLRHSESVISTLDLDHVLRLGHTMVCPYNWMKPF